MNFNNRKKTFTMYEVTLNYWNKNMFNIIIYGQYGVICSVFRSICSDTLMLTSDWNFPKMSCTSSLRHYLHLGCSPHTLTAVGIIEGHIPDEACSSITFYIRNIYPINTSCLDRERCRVGNF